MKGSVSVVVVACLVGLLAGSAWGAVSSITFSNCGGSSYKNYIGLDLCVGWDVNCTDWPCDAFKEGVRFPGSAVYSFTLQNSTGHVFGTFTFQEGLELYWNEDNAFQCVEYNGCFAQESVGLDVPPGQYKIVPGSSVTSQLTSGVAVVSKEFTVAVPTFSKPVYVSTVETQTTFRFGCTVKFIVSSADRLFGGFDVLATDSSGTPKSVVKVYGLKRNAETLYWRPRVKDWSPGAIPFTSIETGSYFTDNTTDYPDFTVLKCEKTGQCGDAPCAMSVCLSNGECSYDHEDASDRSCFIATAAYGTPLDVRLCLLRAFRDAKLVPHTLGRVLVATYYSVSPQIARVIAVSRFLRWLVRGMLWPIVWMLDGRPAEPRAVEL